MDILAVPPKPHRGLCLQTAGLLFFQMLSDRSYMYRETPAAGSRVLTWMLCAMVVGFVVQSVFGRWLGSADFERLFALSSGGLRRGYLWSLFSYAFLHGGILHLLFNGLFLYFLGRELAPMLGERRFLVVSLVAALGGGLAWLAASAGNPGSVLVGASAIVLGNREITFLLFFVLPVTVRPRIAVWVILGIEVLGLLFSELPGGRFDTGIAYSAHLGGMLVGWTYFRYLHSSSLWGRSGGPAIELPSWLRRKHSSPARGGAPYQVNLSSPPKPDLKAEVDRVLDKINSQGFGALTEEEKRILDQAKDMLSRR
jgi:membrane associated rhomboid family serine protease